MVHSITPSSLLGSNAHLRYPFMTNELMFHMIWNLEAIPLGVSADTVVVSYGVRWAWTDLDWEERGHCFHVK